MLDEKGYVSDIAQNLIEGVRLDDFEADLRQGDGNELKSKFRAAHSSSALAINNFAPFKADLAALRLPGAGRFASLHFERKCPHGLVGRRSPNLDVLLVGASGIVAIESKCLEPLTPHVADFAPAYENEIRDDRRKSAWFEEMQRLTSDPHAYRWLDAAQLVKHAFGLAYSFSGQPVMLLYLFWEPINAQAYQAFAEHRAELERFASSIRGGGLEFAAMSYPDLWAFWAPQAAPAWLSVHVGRLRSRYGVSA